MLVIQETDVLPQPTAVWRNEDVRVRRLFERDIVLMRRSVNRRASAFTLSKHWLIAHG